MTRLPNPARGEVALTIGEIDLIIAVTMQGLATLSGFIGTKTIHELYQRLVGFEPATVLAAIECLTVEGDRKAAKKHLALSDMQAWTDAITAALMAHVKDGDDLDDPAPEGASGNG